MVKHEDIWREQCDATVTIRARYGEQAALDYLIGEKLLHFTGAARKHPDFARQLPSFVARVRQMFARDVMLRYLAELEARLTPKSGRRCQPGGYDHHLREGRRQGALLHDSRE
jgi:hypothetical protein